MRTYPVEPYGARLRVHVGDRRPKGFRDTAAATKFRHDTHTVTVYLRPAATAGDVTHEAVHAAGYVLGACGVPFTAEENEALAYLAGYLADCCLDALTRAQ